MHCNVLIKNSFISEHSICGVSIKSAPNDNVRIENYLIKRNGNAGILCLGVRGSPRLRFNEIKQNMGDGIKVGITNEAKIIKCMIH